MSWRTTSAENHAGAGVAGFAFAVFAATWAWVNYSWFASALYSALMRTSDPFHLILLALTAAILVLAVVLAAVGVAVTSCLLVVMLAAAGTVIGYETVGHRHVADALEPL